MDELVKCKDCRHLKAYFVGSAYCHGNLEVKKPEMWQFDGIECDAGEIISNPSKKRKCSGFEPISKSAHLSV